MKSITDYQSTSTKGMILYHLGREAFLTALQLQVLLAIEKLNTVQNALTELRKGGLVEKRRVGEFTPVFWKLKRRKTSINEWSKKQEVACSELYVALELTGQLESWSAVDDQKRGFRFDRAFEFNGRRFYIELETGSQYDKREDVIAGKIKSYMKLDGWFHVIFCTMDYNQHVSASRYGSAILEIIERTENEINREKAEKKERRISFGTRFLATSHSTFRSNPLGDILVHPSNKIFSLDDLTETLQKAA